MSQFHAIRSWCLSRSQRYRYKTYSHQVTVYSWYFPSSIAAAGDLLPWWFVQVPQLSAWKSWPWSWDQFLFFPFCIIQIRCRNLMRSDHDAWADHSAPGTKLTPIRSQVYSWYLLSSIAAAGDLLPWCFVQAPQLSSSRAGPDHTTTPTLPPSLSA